MHSSRLIIEGTVVSVPEKELHNHVTILVFLCKGNRDATHCMAVLQMTKRPSYRICMGMQGIDSFGVDRDVVKSLNFSTLDVPMPISKLRSIEFKRTFRIPDCKPQGNKVSSGTYNHPWPLTDMLICWDMKWDKAHQASDPLLLVCKMCIDIVDTHRWFPAGCQSFSLWVAVLMSS